MFKKLKTSIHNKFYFFPSVKIRNLERKLAHYERKLNEAENRSLESLVEAMEDSETLKEKVDGSYVKWKAALRQKLISKIGHCQKCGLVSRKLTLDHIVPADFLRSMGINPNYHRDERNFALMCDLCNSKKSHFFDFTNPKTKPLLLEYINLVPDVKKAPSFPQDDY